MRIPRVVQKSLAGFHAGLYRMTGGTVGRKLGRVENILLTTTGRKSGQPRTTPLTITTEGDRIVLVASAGGAEKHPDWYQNLSVNPIVTVQRGKQKTEMRARTATPEERTELWPKVVATYKGYSSYQQKTARLIPLVICEPVA